MAALDGTAALCRADGTSVRDGVAQDGVIAVGTAVRDGAGIGGVVAGGEVRHRSLLDLHPSGLGLELLIESGANGYRWRTTRREDPGRGIMCCLVCGGGGQVGSRSQPAGRSTAGPPH